MDIEDRLQKINVTLHFLAASKVLRDDEHWELSDLVDLGKSLIASHCLQSSMSLHEFYEMLQGFFEEYKVLKDKTD